MHTHSPIPTPSPISPHKQVFCNGLVPALLAVAYGWLGGLRDLPLAAAASSSSLVGAAAAAALGTDSAVRAIVGVAGAFLGYMACCCGDTWCARVRKCVHVCMCKCVHVCEWVCVEWRRGVSWRAIAGRV